MSFYYKNHEPNIKLKINGLLVKGRIAFLTEQHDFYSLQ